HHSRVVGTFHESDRRILEGGLAMHFRNPLFNWIAQHPGVIFWTLFAVVLALPIFLYLLPIKKVPLRYNLRNLQARWVTTLVTALVFTAVVGLLVTMLAFGKGMERLTEGTG